MPEKPDIPVNWEQEKKNLKQEYKRRLKGLEASRQTTEMVGQVLTRGFLPIFILHLLDERPRNGNDIAVQIQERTGGGWQPSTGGIYPILRRFEKQGLAVGHWDDPDKRTQRLYELTDRGRGELELLRQALKPKVLNALNVLQMVLKEVFSEEGQP